MRACIIIDPLASLKPYKDSSIDLAYQAQERGYRVDVCEFSDISTTSHSVFAQVSQLTLGKDVRDDKAMTSENHTLGNKERVDMADYDVIFIRKDPPYDSTYFSLSLLLDPLVGKVQFVNSPRGLRQVSEKLSAFLFPGAGPETLATYDVGEARAFASQYDKVVLKPCYLGSGQGILISSADSDDFDASIEATLNYHPKGPVIVQQFLPEVERGDARVMLLKGEVLGALGRKPPEGDFRANIAVGGTEFAVELTAKQKDTAEKVGAMLVEAGIVFAGLDFIGDRLIEINVTSPTLIQELRRVGGPDVSSLIWDHLERNRIN